MTAFGEIHSQRDKGIVRLGSCIFDLLSEQSAFLSLQKSVHYFLVKKFEHRLTIENIY